MVSFEITAVTTIEIQNVIGVEGKVSRYDIL
jgi:hypothetical protein